ncbi:DMT family transporter [Pseudorhodoferax sp.]|uniref:DMT family transporter n=1 Tax=Pseudorhodoferax sp. TaxID=1993553 RepID=UPI002DD64CAA|nr:DMT family transporter [Pseudorhodoferax sp.]
MSPPTGGVTPRALLLLLLLACLFGGNHVAARFAFDDGVDVATAVVLRSGTTALVVGLLVVLQGVSWQTNGRQRGALAVISLLVAVQSLSLYAAVARLPVALALLAFNTWPMWTALWARVLYGHRPDRRTVIAIPVLLAGLALALDVFGAASGLGAQAQWSRIGSGVAFALLAGGTFGLVMVVTQHEVAGLDGRLRSAITMAVVGILALVVVAMQGGLHLPRSGSGWWGLALLTLLYGTAFTMMFTLLPKLGVVGSSPILNVEPVAAMVMAWALLGQRIAPVQVAGGLIVVATVMVLGLRRR